MAYRPKLRLLIKAGGQISELFGIHQRPSGDLLITIKRNNFHIMPGKGTRKLLEERLSVHVSPNSDGHTVKRTLAAQGGVQVISRNVVIPEDGNIIWPLFGKRYADLRNPVFSFTPDVRDTSQILDEFNPEYNSLCLMLIVSSKVTGPIGFWGEWKFTGLEFSHFSLSVWWSYCPIPSIQQGDTVAPETTSDRVSSMDPLNLFSCVGRMNHALAGRLTERMVAAADAPPNVEELRDKIFGLSMIRSSRPFENFD